MTPSAPGQRREPAPARAGTLRNRKARRYQAEPAWKTFNFNEQEQAASRNAVNVRAAGPRAFAIRNSARIALGDVPHHGRSGQVRGHRGAGWFMQAGRPGRQVEARVTGTADEVKRYSRHADPPYRRTGRAASRPERVRFAGAS